MEHWVRIVGDSEVGGAGGVLDPTKMSYAGLIFQQGKEVLAKELNFMMQTENHMRAEWIRSIFSSGFWPVNRSEAAAEGDLEEDGGIFFPATANVFWVGLSRALVNGYALTVAGSDLTTGSKGYVAINAGSPPGAGSRTDLVFLECWFEEVGPTGATGASTDVYEYGGVANDTLTNDIQDATVGHETTRRVQLRWRIRVATDVDFGTYPLGVNDPDVKAFKTDGTASTYTYSQDAKDLPLYKAGDGTLTAANAIGCIDGYVYALPMFRLDRNVGEALEFADILDFRESFYHQAESPTVIAIQSKDLCDNLSLQDVHATLNGLQAVAAPADALTQMYASVRLRGYRGGPITIRLFMMFGATDGPANVHWVLNWQKLEEGDGVVADTALDHDMAVGASAGDTYHTETITLTGAYPVTVPDMILKMNLQRLGTDGGDTYEDYVYLHLLEVEYR